ncbi:MULTISPECIES: helix-turn-helix domain-containing protein [Streptomyces]|uniref:helix-turn-helix domain-containing protein n=1 Tax=Streptomyces TaxID=1883 RepID=UPI000B9EBDA9|nr:helix-turn-helix transcriptional regulator [Streptomyces kasugaensis]
MIQRASDAEESGEGGQKARDKVLFLRDELAPSAPCMVLGRGLRKRRDALKLHQQDVSKALGWSKSKISRIESGLNAVKRQDLEILFSLYRVDEDDQEPLRELALIGNRPMWWKKWSGITTAYLQAVMSFEEVAQRIRSYEPQYLNGLLQTPEYAEVLIKRGPDQSRYAALVELRQRRQAKFAAARGKELLCVIDEASLLQPVGNAQIMRRQVQHLIELSEDPRYQLRLAEQKRANLQREIGSTTLFDFAETLLPTIAYTEIDDGGLVIQDEESVDRKVRKFDELRHMSLNPPKTKQKLRDLLRSNYYR